jgi:DMSO/TMAO reductase YedYZ molybdopterin-dependent catalytic subunit
VPRRSLLSRRRFLVLASGVLATVVAVRGLTRRGSRSAGGRAASDGAGLEDFPVLNVEDGPPPVAAPDRVLEVDGLVERTMRLDRTAWLALPRTQETRDLYCVEGWSVADLDWEGVRVSELLSRAGPRPDGRFVTFHAYDGTYTDTLTLAEAQAPDTLLADTLDGRALPAEHGGPLRLVIPSQLGYKNVKWVVRLEVTATRARGYWERRGYPAEAPIP